MQDRITHYFRTLSERLNAKFMTPVVTKAAAGLCCVDINPRYVNFSYVIDDRKEKPNLVLCESEPYEAEIGWELVLKAMVQRHHLQNMRCSWVLQPENYHMLLTEPLPVSPAEFQAAIRWKIKASLPFPVEDTVIDSFKIPPKTTVGTNDNLMIVASMKSQLHKMSEKITHCGLDLKVIDIPELALLNIINLYVHDEKSTALIYMQETWGTLIITRQKQLYMSRRFDFSMEALSGVETLPDEKRQVVDKITLEIQRSFDYYQRQWRQPQPTRILWVSLEPVAQVVMDYLEQRLPVPLMRLDLAAQMTVRHAIGLEKQGKCLLAIGGALRQESGANAATN